MYKFWQIHHISSKKKRNPSNNFDKFNKSIDSMTDQCIWIIVSCDSVTDNAKQWSGLGPIKTGYVWEDFPPLEPIYWRKWVFPTKKKCSGAQGRRWSIARSPLDNSCLRRTPDFSLKATVKIYHIDLLLSDISSRISCKNLSLPSRTLISEKYFLSLRIWIWKCLF